MAAANILTTGGPNGEVSADVTVAAGTSLTVGLKGQYDNSIKNALVSIQAKDDTGAYKQDDSLSGVKNIKVITGPGVYRFVRKRGNVGVYSA